jgi:diaminopimelate epimerase
MSVDSQPPAMPVFKAHAYGNDFLLVPFDDPVVARSTGTARIDGPTEVGPPIDDWSSIARAICHRHHGLGADGLILYTTSPSAATMRLFNADGSPSELSGNGLRCLGAVVAREQHLGPGAVIVVETDAGTKRLELQGASGSRFTFRTFLGAPTDVRRTTIAVEGESVMATTLGMGNPQCVVLGPLPRMEQFHRLGPALATHALFPAGTNVEFAFVESPRHVRILIWERGVGPTMSSGTGTAASAVAAMAHAGADRDLEVTAPGGTQRVEWREDGVYLTGWAQVVLQGHWIHTR